MTFKRTLSLVLTVCMLASIVVIGAVTASANYGDELRRPVITDIVVSNPGGEDEEIPATNRYYFYMPEDWRNEFNDSYDGESLDSCEAGVYWYAGSYMPSDNQGDLSNAWPGYSVPNVDEADSNIFYCDVPQDSGKIIFNNLVDGGMDDTQPYYSAACQTKDIKCDNYEVDDDEYGFYETLEGMDGMIYVCNPVDTEVNEYSGKTTCKGDWFYYYGDGTYGPKPTKEEAEASEEVYSGGQFPTYGMKLSTRFLTLYVNDPDAITANVDAGDDTDAVATITKGEEFFSIVQNPETGVVTATAKAEGEGEITFTKTDEEGQTFTATCNVSVYVMPTRVKVAKDALTVNVGKTVKAGATIQYPMGKTTYTSSNSKVASVTSAGVIKGVKAGKATVTVKNNGKSATINVTVKQIANTMTAKAVNKTVKLSALKKKNQTVKGAVKVTKPQGKVTYAKASGDKKITVAKNGVITLKKGMKKGTYTVKVKVTAAGNTTYTKATKTVAVKIAVK